MQDISIKCIVANGSGEYRRFWGKPTNGVKEISKNKEYIGLVIETNNLKIGKKPAIGNHKGD